MTTPPPDRGFTDEDLKKLKGAIKNPVVDPNDPERFHDFDLEAFIRRLDAAERVGHLGKLLHGPAVGQCVLDQCDFCLAMKAWLRSKGLPPSGDGEKGV